MTEDLFLDWGDQIAGANLRLLRKRSFGAAVIPCIPVVLGRKHSLAIYMIL